MGGDDNDLPSAVRTGLDPDVARPSPLVPRITVAFTITCSISCTETPMTGRMFDVRVVPLDELDSHRAPVCVHHVFAAMCCRSNILQHGQWSQYLRCQVLQVQGNAVVITPGGGGRGLLPLACPPYGDPMGSEERDGVALTNLDQPLFDGAEATKRDLVDYLDGMADRIVPELRDRPLSVIRVLRGQ